MDTNITSNSKDIRIFVFEKSEVNFFLEEIQSPKLYRIIFVLSGRLILEIDQIKFEFHDGELLIIPLKAMIQIKKSNAKWIIVSFSSEFVMHNSIRHPYIGYFEFFILYPFSKIPMENEDLYILRTILGLLKQKIESGARAFKAELLLFNFNLFIFEIASIYYRNLRRLNLRSSRKEKLVLDFFSLLEKFCHKEHKVSFYADALFVTNGHLNRIMKEIMRKSVKQIIEEALILEAKILLLNGDMTISDICDELEFSSVSFFSYFFKKHSGMSPSDFRNKV